ncbi:MAG: hypothetical protein K6A63_03375 [Acholeplasmatales bacterium]|nr:hypothetical protein [Acholeplasmatales bacterium]
MSYFDLGIEVLKKIESLGYEAYLVGGCVRDMLLNYPINDIDITTNMPIDEIANHFEVRDNGSKYLSVTIIYEDHEFEITHFRRDIEYTDHRHPEVVLVNTAKEDSYRRDFTVNALYYTSEGKILDFHNGQEDLKNKKLKMIGDPDERFEEDALRILRALNFAGKLGFIIEENTALAMERNCDLLEDLSDDRIFDYFKRILYGITDYGIQYINHYDLFDFIPDYKELLAIAKRNYREEDLVFYYYFRYNKFLNVTTSGEKKCAEEAKRVLDNNFDNVSLYKYSYAYLRCENVFLNLGYNVNEIDERLKNLPLNADNKLAISGDDLKPYYSGKEIGIKLEEALYAVLNRRVINEKKDILEYLKR